MTNPMMYLAFDSGRDLGREEGAAVAFGLIAMGEAIRRTEQHRRNLRMWEIGEACGTHCLECLEARCEGWPSKYWCKRHKEGAAVAFGLMGMAFAIQQWEREREGRELDARYQAAMRKIWGAVWK